ncbi:hypothetical protein FCULG_00007835 [Fusarium culmorum]|uniref:Uncharacterized protein n=1 Tax=Fusarium culmorum TaxID=5516 RepID=A0A2T4H2Z5_FUSCU|nr:hypothetical protein FCULG_00007835 [Fusarium culmorum]
MASRNGTAAPMPRKIVTYGKPLRKRFMRDAIPLRTADTFSTPTATESATKPSKPSLPRSASDPSTRSPDDSRSDDPTSTRTGAERKTEARDATDTRKRKRPQAALSEMISEEPPSIIQKQSNPTTTLPRRPLGGSSKNDGKAATAPAAHRPQKRAPKTRLRDLGLCHEASLTLQLLRSAQNLRRLHSGIATMSRPDQRSGVHD